MLVLKTIWNNILCAASKTSLMPLIWFYCWGLWCSFISFSSAQTLTQYRWLQMIQTGWNEPFLQTGLWFLTSVVITLCPVWIQISPGWIIWSWTLICSNLHLRINPIPSSPPHKTEHVTFQPRRSTCQWYRPHDGSLHRGRWQILSVTVGWRPEMSPCNSEKRQLKNVRVSVASKQFSAF